MGYKYIDAVSCIKCTFRKPGSQEKIQSFQDEYHEYLIDRLRINPQLITDNIQESMKTAANLNVKNWVIDGIFNPRDFSQLFNYNEDIIIFLNRIDSLEAARDYETIGISVMRDYCFWLASAALLDKGKWMEYNFKMNPIFRKGEDMDSVKTLGSKNTVYIVKSFDRVISHMKEQLSRIKWN